MSTINRILNRLPMAALHARLVKLQAGSAIYEAGSVFHYVYFPTTAIVSLLVVLESGDATELAIIGNEGAIGLASLTGRRSAGVRSLVQQTGYAFRVRQQLLRDAWDSDASVRHVIDQGIRSVFVQASYTVACNRFHSVEQQLCRALLTRLDRVTSGELTMTQQSFANVLGVRREAITLAARNLRAAGAIRYARGRVDVMDRRKLEARTCECYAIIKREIEKALNGL